jgi:hypothetical protein
MSRELKNPLSYNTELTDTFAKMSISHKYHIVGSSNLLKTIYTTDFDLNTEFNSTKDPVEMYDHIYIFFKHLFEICKKNSDTIIVDFKCGTYQNEPIRWGYDDIQKGTKHKIKFVDALKQKSRIKLDLVYNLNNSFVEVSMIYYISVGEYSNFTKEEFTTDAIVSELKKDISKYTKEKNYIKVLKRKYSLFNKMDTRVALQTKLLDFFNSPVGIIYKAIGDLNTLIEVKNQDFKRIPVEALYKFQQIIKQNLNSFDLPDVFEALNRPKISVRSLESLVKKLTKITNKACLDEFGFLLNGSV